MNSAYYDHPILWSEDRKRFEETKIAQESIKEWRHKKESERLKQINDRKEYQKMIVEHRPWGKPGGGAPNKNIRMKNITLDGLYPETFTDCRNLPLPFRFKSKGGGGGAPIRSASGRMLASFRDDPILGFCDSLRNYVDIELRYKASAKKKKKYKQQLDKLVAEKEKNRVCENKNMMDIDKKLKSYRSPWGRPGPGGNPWRNPRSVGNKFLQSLGWTNKEDLHLLDEENVIPSIKTKTKDIKNTFDQTCPKCVCSCLNDLDEKVNTDLTNNKTKRKNSKINSNIKQPKCKNMIEPKARPCMITGGVELVPLLAKRRAQQRPISLSTTDVTRYKDGKGEWKDCGTQYLNELNRQITRKARDTQMNKLNDVQTSKKHHETWDAFWGRPGGGAPRSIKNKLNLNDLLYKIPLV